jgi:hypothetical protein
MKDRILILINSYRDPHLMDTICSFKDNAVHPERVSFIICLQDDDPVIQEKLCTRDDCEVISVNPREHISLGSAYNLLREKCADRDEEYALFTEPHVYAVSGWDEYHIRELKRLGDRAVISNYLSGFSYDDIPDTPERGCCIGVIGILENRHVHIQAGRDITEPYSVRGCFIIENNVFGRLSYIRDCPIDPHMYLNISETYLSLQLFTHGYDVYHTREMYLYHYYVTPSDPKKKAEDNERLSGGDYLRMMDATEGGPRMRKYLGLIGDDNRDLDLGEYVPGTARTVYAFEQFAGIDFATRKVSTAAFSGKYLNDRQPLMDYLSLVLYYRELRASDEDYKALIKLGRKKLEQRQKEIVNTLKETAKGVYLFSDGKVSRFLRELLTCAGVWVRGYIVSEKETDERDGVPVFAPEEIAGDRPLVLVPVKGSSSTGTKILESPRGWRVMRIDPDTVMILMMVFYQ